MAVSFSPQDHPYPLEGEKYSPRESLVYGPDFISLQPSELAQALFLPNQTYQISTVFPSSGHIELFDTSHPDTAWTILIADLIHWFVKEEAAEVTGEAIKFSVSPFVIGDIVASRALYVYLGEGSEGRWLLSFDVGRYEGKGFVPLYKEQTGMMPVEYNVAKLPFARRVSEVVRRQGFDPDFPFSLMRRYKSEWRRGLQAELGAGELSTGNWALTCDTSGTVYALVERPSESFRPLEEALKFSQDHQISELYEGLAKYLVYLEVLGHEKTANVLPWTVGQEERPWLDVPALLQRHPEIAEETPSLRRLGKVRVMILNMKPNAAFVPSQEIIRVGDRIYAGPLLLVKEEDWAKFNNLDWEEVLAHELPHNDHYYLAPNSLDTYEDAVSYIAREEEGPSLRSQYKILTKGKGPEEAWEGMLRDFVDEKWGNEEKGEFATKLRGVLEGGWQRKELSEEALKLSQRWIPLGIGTLPASLVTGATLQHKTLRLTYTNLGDGQTRTRVVEPHYIFDTNTTKRRMLLTWCRQANNWRMFCLEDPIGTPYPGFVVKDVGKVFPFSVEETKKRVKTALALQEAALEEKVEAGPLELKVGSRVGLPPWGELRAGNAWEVAPRKWCQVRLKGEDDFDWEIRDEEGLLEKKGKTDRRAYEDARARFRPPFRAFGEQDRFEIVEEALKFSSEVTDRGFPEFEDLQVGDSYDFQDEEIRGTIWIREVPDLETGIAKGHFTSRGGDGEVGMEGDGWLIRAGYNNGVTSGFFFNFRPKEREGDDLPFEIPGEVLKFSSKVTDRGFPEYWELRNRDKWVWGQKELGGDWGTMEIIGVRGGLFKVKVVVKAAEGGKGPEDPYWIGNDFCWEWEETQHPYNYTFNVVKGNWHDFESGFEFTEEVLKFSASPYNLLLSNVSEEELVDLDFKGPLKVGRDVMVPGDIFHYGNPREFWVYVSGEGPYSTFLFTDSLENAERLSPWVRRNPPSTETPFEYEVRAREGTGVRRVLRGCSDPAGKTWIRHRGPFVFTEDVFKLSSSTHPTFEDVEEGDSWAATFPKEPGYGEIDGRRVVEKRNAEGSLVIVYEGVSREGEPKKVRAVVSRLVWDQNWKKGHYHDFIPAGRFSEETLTSMEEVLKFSASSFKLGDIVSSGHLYVYLGGGNEDRWLVSLHVWKYEVGSGFVPLYKSHPGIGLSEYNAMRLPFARIISEVVRRKGFDPNSPFSSEAAYEEELEHALQQVSKEGELSWGAYSLYHDTSGTIYTLVERPVSFEFTEEALKLSSLSLEQAKNLSYGDILYAKGVKNKDGTPGRYRVNGKPRTWKKSPDRVMVPVKRGLYEFGYVTERDLDEFCLTEEEALGKKGKEFSWTEGSFKLSQSREPQVGDIYFDRESPAFKYDIVVGTYSSTEEPSELAMFSFKTLEEARRLRDSASDLPWKGMGLGELDEKVEKILGFSPLDNFHSYFGFAEGLLGDKYALIDPAPEFFEIPEEALKLSAGEDFPPYEALKEGDHWRWGTVESGNCGIMEVERRFDHPLLMVRVVTDLVNGRSRGDPWFRGLDAAKPEFWDREDSVRRMEYIQNVSSGHWHDFSFFLESPEGVLKFSAPRIDLFSGSYAQIPNPPGKALREGPRAIKRCSGEGIGLETGRVPGRETDRLSTICGMEGALKLSREKKGGFLRPGLASLALLWHLTKDCNYACSYCYGGPEAFYQEPVSYTLASCKEFLDGLRAKHGNLQVGFTGGEPSCCDLFFPLLKEVSRAGDVLFVCTNLSAGADPFIENVIDPDLCWITASYHTEFAELEDFAREVERLQAHGFHVSISVLLFPPLLEETLGAVGYFQRNLPQVPVEGGAYFGKYEGQGYPEAYTAEERGRIEAVCGLNIEHRIEQTVVPPGRLCPAGKDFFVISLDGGVRRCTAQVPLRGEIWPQCTLNETAEPCPSDTCRCSDTHNFWGSAWGPNCLEILSKEGAPLLEGEASLLKLSTNYSSHDDIIAHQMEIARPFDDQPPSSVGDVYYTFAYRKEGAYPNPTGTSGKWRIFCDESEIDGCWRKVKQATEEGRLGAYSKAMTRIHVWHRDNRKKAICVYTYDWRDKEDVSRILKELRKLGFGQTLIYKTDEFSLRSNKVFPYDVYDPSQLQFIPLEEVGAIFSLEEDLPIVVNFKASATGYSTKPSSMKKNKASDYEYRDYTINSLQLDVKTGEVIDPSGRGLQDLEGDILNTCSPPEESIQEDPLRILRGLIRKLRDGLKPTIEVQEAWKWGASLLKGLPEYYSALYLARMLEFAHPETVQRQLAELGLSSYLGGGSEFPDFEDISVGDHWQEGDRVWEVVRKMPDSLQLRSDGDEVEWTADELESHRKGSYGYVPAIPSGFPLFSDLGVGDQWVMRVGDVELNCTVVGRKGPYVEILTEQSGGDERIAWGSLLYARLCKRGKLSSFSIEKDPVKLHSSPSRVPTYFRDMDFIVEAPQLEKIVNKVHTELGMEGKVSPIHTSSQIGLYFFTVFGRNSVGRTLEVIRKVAGQENIPAYLTGGFLRDLLFVSGSRFLSNLAEVRTHAPWVSSS